MNIYNRKKQWKLFLFAVALAIVAGSMWYTNIIVNKVAQEEKKNIRIWADAIHRKTTLVKYIESFFQRIRKQDRNRVTLLAEAYNQVIKTDNPDTDLTFYVDIIRTNETIPVVLTDEDGRIINSKNVDFDQDTVIFLTGRLMEDFSKYQPIEVRYFLDRKNYLYYKDSKLYSELRHVLDDLVRSFFSEVVINAASVPVIITDSTKRNVIDFGNLEPDKVMDPEFIQATIAEMENDNAPIEIDLVNQGKSYIFYKGSFLLTQLTYYPVVQLAIIALFLLVGYMMFNTARRSEQNQVWVGLAKETAHQLGTPLSSMIAWMEILKMEDVKHDAIHELNKDVVRLEKITERFSKIGSVPKLSQQNIVEIVHNAVNYLKTRTSRKIAYEIEPGPEAEIYAPVNLHLFEWVIENITKNAVDAMGTSGKFTVHISEENGLVFIDLTDTGKGIPKSKFRSIFHPGYTSKKHGWGLGLSLSERIIKNYHRGRIFVKSSTLEKGTTFRIVLRKKIRKT
ncbi:MAG: sensor histidine kinase [Bacteroidales bacterium]